MRLTAPFDQNIKTIISDIASSEKLTMGAEVARFERQLAEFLGVRHVIMVNSGSSANLAMVAVAVLERILNRHEPVAVPALAWSTTYSPYALFDIPMKIVDIDRTACMPPGNADDCQAVMAVHALGNAAHVEYDVPVLEDACEAFGSQQDDGAFCGTSGLMGTLSFFYSHHTQTIEGGAIVTNDDTLAMRLKQFREHGWTRNTGGAADSTDFVYLGLNLRPTEIQGALGQYQLQKFIDTDWALRKQNTRNYMTAFDGFPVAFRKNAVAFGFPFVCAMADKKDVKERLHHDGIETRDVVGGNIIRHRMAHYMRVVPSTEDYQYADVLHDRGFLVGNPAVPITTDQFRNVKRYWR